MNALVKRDESFAAIESVLMEGDLSKLNSEQRVTYYNRVCDSVGLNPLTRPFDYIRLNGKLVLYAKRDCTDQLRTVKGVSVSVVARERIDDLYVVTARATDKGGRVDESTGAVSIAGLRGEALANAFMKAETKAKRRVTLSLCGLGIIDESEVETVPGAQPEPMQEAPVARIAPAPKPANGEGAAKAWVEQGRGALEAMQTHDELAEWREANSTRIERLGKYAAVTDYLDALITETSERIDAAGGGRLV